MTCEFELRILPAESAHRVAGVASFILLADIGDQRLWALHLNFESGAAVLRQPLAESSWLRLWRGVSSVICNT